MEDANIELNNVKTYSRDLEKKQRRFDQQLAEERANLQKVKCLSFESVYFLSAV